MAFALPDLPFAKDAFGELLSVEAFDYHHGRHHNAYVVKANELIAADHSLQGRSLVDLIRSSSGSLFNQVGQIWNHSFYWQCLSPVAQKPTGELARRIAEDFGSHDALVDALKAEAVGHFASGWAALNLADDRLVVTSYHDADCPVAHNATPLLIFDVWEHAYYIDYRNARADYAEKVLRGAINWDFVAQNLDGNGAERADQQG